MKKFQVVILFLVSLFILSACSKEKTIEEEQQTFTAQYNWPLASFEAMNQDETSISLEDLKGEVWIMDMIFTNCETVCLPMTNNMAKLQKIAKEKNVKVHLISFSVDPSVDTSKKLKEYASGYGADFSNWDLLTGYTEDDIKRIAKSVKTLAEKPSGTTQVTHSTKFFLVNKDGIAVKAYDGIKPPFDEMIEDIKILK